ncbi:MAG TPA: Ig-like domain-containing protein [Anaerolineae bacterium]|nr:Ig-like domain-containing protein [Anaerolineae bacterium]
MILWVTFSEVIAREHKNIITKNKSSVNFVNTLPTATDGNYGTLKNTTLSGNVITEDTGYGLDYDLDGDPLSIYTYTLPLTGTLDLRPSGAFTYTPPAD